MSSNNVEINVEILGTAKAQKALKKVATQMEDLDKAGQKVGETFGETGSSLSQLAGESGQSLGEALGAVENLTGSLGQLRTAAAAGGFSISGLAGPIGLVVVAAQAAASAFGNFMDTVTKTSVKLEVYKASVTESVQSMQELIEKGVALTESDTARIRRANLEVQKTQSVDKDLQKRAADLQFRIKGLEESILKGRKLEQAIQTERSNNLLATSKLRLLEQEKLKRIFSDENTLRDRILSLQKEQLSVNKQIRAQAESVVSTQQKLNNLMDELNEKSTEQLIKKSTELLNLEDRLSILRAQGRSDLEAQVKAIELAGEKRVTSIIKSQKALQSFSEEFDLGGGVTMEVGADPLTEEAKIRNDLIIEEEKRTQREILKIRQSFARQQRSQRRARIAKRKSDEDRLIIQLAQIERLKIQIEEEGFEERFQLTELDYRTRIKLARENNNQIVIATKQRDLEIQNLNRQMHKQNNLEFDREEARQIKLANEADQRMIERIGMMEQSIDMEIALLETRYQMELRMAKGNSEQITLINEKYLHNFSKIQEKTKVQFQDFMPTVEAFGKGLAESAVAAAMFGESFSASVGAVLKSLSMEAGVKALMETAYGVAASILEPQLAAKHFQSAAIFASASIAAKGASMALGTSGASGGGGTGGGGGGASPSTAPPLREDADSSRSIVYNINFGGTVYDTKKAAQIAFSDAVTRQQARHRRGSPRAV